MEAEITLPPPKAPSNPVDIPTEQEEQTGLDLDEDIT